MKKIFFTALIALGLISPSFAQSLEKGNMVIGAGAGIGIYKTTIKDKTNTNVTEDKDTSGAVVFPFTFEYAAMNWLGIGVRLGYSNYLTDSAGKAQGDKATGMDAMACVNAHFLRSKHVDMFVSAEYGYSHFAFTTNADNNSKAIASGTGYSFGINTRFLFGKDPHFGIHIRYAREGYNYPNGTISDNTNINTVKFSLKGNGGVFGIGLQYKL